MISNTSLERLRYNTGAQGHGGGLMHSASSRQATWAQHLSYKLFRLLLASSVLSPADQVVKDVGVSPARLHDLHIIWEPILEGSDIANAA